jgi:hypothetical protein
MTNDAFSSAISDYYTASQIDNTLSNYYTSTQIDSTLSNYSPTSAFANVAFTGDYNDLLSKPTIPSWPSVQLTALSSSISAASLSIISNNWPQVTVENNYPNGSTYWKLYPYKETDTYYGFAGTYASGQGTLGNAAQNVFVKIDINSARIELLFK